MDNYDVIFLVEPSSDTDHFAVDAVRATSIEYRNRIRDYFRIYVDMLSNAAKEKLIVLNSDDIFGELDGNRANKISEYMKEIGQAFITLTDLSNFKYLTKNNDDFVLNINNGQVANA